MKINDDLNMNVVELNMNNKLVYLIVIENVLKELSVISIKGILFYDISILYLKQKLNIPIDLVWNQTHMVTNYNTCNYYYDKGVKFAYISGEITLEEIIEIQEKSKSSLMVEIVSHQIMSHSKRKLITNY